MIPHVNYCTCGVRLGEHNDSHNYIIINRVTSVTARRKATPRTTPPPPLFDKFDDDVFSIPKITE